MENKKDFEVDVRFNGTEREYMAFRKAVEEAGGTVMQSRVVSYKNDYANGHTYDRT